MENHIPALIKYLYKIYYKYHPYLQFLKPSGNKLELFLHQVEFLLKNMFRTPIRVILGDEIGLGKTVSSIVLARYLYELGEVRRVLVAVPRVLVLQWLSELERLGVRNIYRIEKYTIKDLVSLGFPEGWYLASMDLIKREEYFGYIKDVPWDMIIVDEAHRLTARLPGRRSRKRKVSLRFEAIGEGLIKDFPDRNVLLLTATPHRGFPGGYLMRLYLLDPTLYVGKTLDTPRFYDLTHEVLIFRRAKRDINELYERKEVFKKCSIHTIIVKVSEDERRFQEALIEFLRDKLREFYEKSYVPAKHLNLLIKLVLKRATSSPIAAMITFHKMLHKREKLLRGELSEEDIEESLRKLERTVKRSLGVGYEEYYEDFPEEEMPSIDDVLNEYAANASCYLSNKDIRRIREFYQMASALREQDSKLRLLLCLLDHHLAQGSKVVIFTEYKDTADYIERKLTERFGRKAVVKLTGEIVRSMREFKRIRRKFEEGEAHILIATDVACEGLNLQVANVLINYDIPWTPIKLEQRLGRVYRLGQRRDVHAYILAVGARADGEVCKVLYTKLLNMSSALGSKILPLLGEKVSLFVEEMISTDKLDKEKAPLVPAVKYETRGKRVPVNESLIIEKLLLGELRQFVEWLLSAIENVKRRIERAFRRPREPIRELRNALNVPSYEQLEEFVKTLTYNLISRYAEGYGVKVDDEGSLIVMRPDGGVIVCKRAIDCVECIVRMQEFGTMPKRPVHIIVPVPTQTGIRKLHVYEVTLYVKGHERYREIVGIDEEYRLLQGVNLLERFIELVNCENPVSLYEVDEDPFEEELIKARVYEFQDKVMRLLERVNRYVDEVSGQFGEGAHDWKTSNKDVQISCRKLAVIHYLPGEKFSGAEIPDRDVEKQAMDYVIEYEKKHGREPKDVSEQNLGYDIISRSKKTGEIERYIEVKGHKDFVLSCELTDNEYKMARELGENYYLNVVCNVFNRRPKLFVFRDPTRTLPIKVVEKIKVERRYVIEIKERETCG